MFWMGNDNYLCHFNGKVFTWIQNMKPERIFIVRHGQSQGNVDRNIYQTLPDYALQLTELGQQQAESAGRAIEAFVGEESIQYYVSPFWRTRQTYLAIKKQIRSKKFKYYEDPRLREQEWSRSVSRPVDEAERDSYGHFYYRFNGGESCADTFDRVSDFMGTMHRDFKKKDFPRNAIVVTHGMTMRLFIMRWYHCSVEEFESWANPKNCEFLVLQLQDGENYELVTPLRKHDIKHPYQFPFNGNAEHFPFPHRLPYENKDLKTDE